MMHALKLEWLKLRSFRAFKLSVILYIILLPLLLLAVQAIFFENDQAANMLSLDILFEFPALWDTTAYWASWLTFFMLVYLSVLSISSEYTNKTLRQNLITGVERSTYLVGKALIMIVISLGATLYLAVITILFGLINGGGSSLFEGITVLPRFFVQNLGYTSFAFMLTVVLRRSGLVMILFFAYVFLVERIIRYLVFGQIFQSLESGSYFPANIFNDTVPFFLINSPAAGLDSDFLRILIDSWIATGVAVAYILLFWAIAFRSFNRRDL